MAVGGRARKEVLVEKLEKCLESSTRVLIVDADNVRSKQMAEIRMALRGRATLLMGKNTLIRTIIRRRLEAQPYLEALMALVRLNVGMVFVNDGEELADIKTVIEQNKVPAAAKQGALAPCDVSIPAGNTGMDPSQTSFFQALGIPTKIVKGLIEIQNDVQIIKAGDKVGASQAAVLQKLNIMPFTYGLVIKQVYDDGVVYSANVLNISDDYLIEKLKSGIQALTQISLATSIPTKSSVPHLFVKAFKNCVASCLETEYTFEQMAKIREMIENPDAFAPVASAAPTSTTAAQAEGSKAAAAEEPEEEEDADMGFSLFD